MPVKSHWAFIVGRERFFRGIVMEDIQTTEEEMIIVKSAHSITIKATYNLRWLETEAQKVDLSGIAASSEGTGRSV